MQKNKHFNKRSVILSIIFAVACLIYAIRLINIQINAEPEEYEGEYFTRTEPIQAMRGEIYDRNGKKLVSNLYTYNFVIDYAGMSGDINKQNEHLLLSLDAMEKNGISDKLSDRGFPFAGQYPNYTYTKEALDETSNTYYRLLKKIAEFELEDQADKPKDSLDADYLEGFYSQNPEAFPTETEMVLYLLERFGLVDSDGNLIFSNSETDKLIKLRYDMALADFSVYNRYVMAEDIDEAFILYIEELSLPGTEFEKKTTRVYEYPGYLSHILGRTGKIYAEDWEYYKELGYGMNDTVGIDGCEFAFENYLRGVDGVMLIKEDADGNIISQTVQKEPIPGQDVYLTVDIDLQIAAEDGLRYNVKWYGKESGAITAINPNTGEVLAIASYPTYDLSTFSQDYDELVADSANPLLNRALNGIYPPGSTFKLGMVALGIDGGDVTPDEKLSCDGIYTAFSGHQPTCWIYNSATGVGNHGLINASEAIAVSCNCYFYELGARVGIEEMNRYYKILGLGESTGIELFESTGILAGPEQKEDGGTAWTDVDTISAAIGQSSNAFTPLQMSLYTSTLLNGGTRYAARLLLKTSSFSDSGEEYVKQSEVLDRVSISKEAFTTITRGMKQMIEDSDSASSYMENIPVTVGGKSGTAQLGYDSNGSEISPHGWFIGAAPYDNPEIVVTTIIENVGSGSRAVIASAKVLEAYQFNGN